MSRTRRARELKVAEKIYYQTENLTIINDDVLATDLIVNASIDLIVTSPPYNVDIQYKSNRDDLSYTEYLDFTEAWLTRCFDWLKEDGRLCLNIPELQT